MYGKSPFQKRLRAYSKGEIGCGRWFRYNVRRPLMTHMNGYMNGFWARKIAKEVIATRHQRNADLSKT